MIVPPAYARGADFFQVRKVLALAFLIKT